jgi:trimeric autotransporter adhesin
MFSPARAASGRRRRTSKRPTRGGSNWFGASVALSGTSLAVGARLESSTATGVNGDQSQSPSYDSGAAYVFSSTGKR